MLHYYDTMLQKSQTPVALQCRLTVSPSVAVTCRMQCDTSEQELGIVESNVGEKCR